MTEWRNENSSAVEEPVIRPQTGKAHFPYKDEVDASKRSHKEARKASRRKHVRFDIDLGKLGAHQKAKKTTA